MPNPLFHIVCGATGAGKTTHARSLADELGAVRFSIDEWMAALFWPDSPQPIQFEWTMARIDRCEALIGDRAEAGRARGCRACWASASPLPATGRRSPISRRAPA